MSLRFLANTLSLMLVVAAVGCGPVPRAAEGEGEGEGEQPAPGELCAGYGEVTEPARFALNSTMYPFSWPDAVDADGANYPIELGHAPCSDDIQWSPFDTLMFVAIPAW